MQRRMIASLAAILVAIVAVRAENARPAAPAAAAAADVKLGDARKGTEIFEGRAVPAASCALCHGVSGKGDGLGAAAIRAAGAVPRDFTNKAEMGKISNAEMIKAITEGGASLGKSIFMTPWKGILTAGQIKDVAAYIRLFAQ